MAKKDRYVEVTTDDGGKFSAIMSNKEALAMEELAMNGEQGVAVVEVKDAGN
jgi:hypothetical protein